MATTLADAFIRVRPVTATFGDELRRDTARHAGEAGRDAGHHFSSGVRGALVGLATTIGGLFAFQQVKNFFAGAIEEARESERVSRITAAAIASTGGAAKVSAGDIDTLSRRLSNMVGVDDEVIQASANVLLRFTNIRNEVGEGNKVFDRATGITLDLATALGKDMDSAAILVGKALNDPIKGLTALSKAGVQFTEEQKNQIKAMVESGDTMGAQKLILESLETRFRGTAEAAADPIQKAKVQWQNFKEELGLKLLPVLGNVAQWFSSKLPAAIGFFDRLGDSIGGVITGFKGFTTDEEATVWNKIGFAIREVVDYITAEVIPVVQRLINTLVDFGRAVVTNVISVIRETIDWFNRHRTALEVLAIVVGSLVGVLTAFKAIQIAIIAVIRAWTVVQLILNGALFANPIGILVLAITALVAAIVFAWRHSETFRDVVKTTWAAIQTAVSFAWTNVIQPALNAMVYFWQNILAPALLWLWQNVVIPVWNGIQEAIRVATPVVIGILEAIGWYISNVVAPVLLWLWQNVITPVWEGIKVAFAIGWSIIEFVFNAIRFWVVNVIAPIMGWLWANVIEPAWEGIKAAFRIGWSIIEFVFNAIKFYVTNVVAPIIGWLWNNVIEPAWAGIKAAFQLGWQIIMTVFNAIKFWIETVIMPAVMFLWHNVIEPAWAGIRAAIEAAWNFIRDNIWNPMMKFITETIPGAFQKGVDAIKSIWETLQKFVHDPVHFIIHEVYNKGVRAVWNWVASKIPGLGELPEIQFAAQGGWIYGKPGIDKNPAMLTKGEFVVNPHAAARNAALLESINRGVGYIDPTFDGRGFMMYAGGGRVSGTNSALLEAHRNHLHAAMDGPNMSYEQIIAAARASGIPFSVGSTFRPGSRGSGGGLDHHSEGRAVDFMGYEQDALGAFFESLPGVIELIHRTNARDYAIFGGGGGGGGGFSVRNPLRIAFDAFWKPIRDRLRAMLDAHLSPLEKGFNREMHAGGHHFINKLEEKAYALIPERLGFGGGGKGGAGYDAIAPFALQALQMKGLPQDWFEPLMTLIGRESNYNPNAINNWDSNAMRGDPSRGLMQTIGSTFNAHKYPGHDNIFDPLDNILAGLGYIVARYGSIYNVQQAVGSSPRGYDFGGALMPGWTMAYNGTGKVENVTTHDKMEDVIDVLEEVLHAVERVAPGVGREINGAASTLVTMSRQERY